MSLKQVLWITAGVVFGTALASANDISYTCDPNIGAATCNTLNTTIAGIYSSTFTNAAASIYIQYGTTGLASSSQYYDNVSYTSYVDALAAHEGDANDLTAVNGLGGDTTNPVVAGDAVTLTSALAGALGLGAISTGTDASGNVCTLGTAGCYNAVITLSNAPDTWYYRSGPQESGTYDIFSAVQHETDEVLGTASCIEGNNGDPSTIATSVNCTNDNLTGVSAADLFRYAAPGVRSYLNTADGTTAYFSIDGGVTNIANYNNQPNGEDYGDWDSSLNRVQNAEGTPDTSGVDITNDGGSEIAVLDAVGYNLTSTVPEPGTMGIFGAGLALLGVLRLRRRS